MRFWKAFLVPKLHRVLEFLIAQGISMAGNLLYGLLCVRLLPISDYAKFAVVFGFLGTLALLMDINFSGTLIPLVGDQYDDRQLIADYVASLRQLAHWLYLLMVPAAMIVFPLLVRKQHWSWQVVAAMVAILLVAAWCARVGGAYGAVLIVRRDRRIWYQAQMISSLGTLALLGVFWGAHCLNAFSAILINVAGMVYVAWAYFRRARHLLGVEGHPSKDKRRGIVHLALPNTPNAIFYAMQGQVSLILITFFGHATAIASIGALGRLSQLFVLFAQMNPLLLEPYFAKLARAKLKKNYVGILAVEGAFCLMIVGLARFFPQLFLWVLGPKYYGLRYEVFLSILNGTLGYLCGVLCIIHSARRFVYWWNGALTIVYSLMIEALFLWKFDLSTVRGVLILNVALASGGLIIHIVTGLYGLMRGPRKTAVSLTAIDQGDEFEQAPRPDLAAGQ
jgi:O-antigen/teichoic acid export membrane protein